MQIETLQRELERLTDQLAELEARAVSAPRAEPPPAPRPTKRGRSMR